jgi:hypothetical protein
MNFPPLVHHQEYRIFFSSVSSRNFIFCYPGDALVCAEHIEFTLNSYFILGVPPSNTLIRYSNMFHLGPSAPSLQYLILYKMIFLLY